jgi:hypothetical protein
MANTCFVLNFLRLLFALDILVMGALKQVKNLSNK